MITTILILFTVFLFSLFFILGVKSKVNKTDNEWIFFALSIVSFISVLSMLYYNDWNLTKPVNNEVNNPSKTEVPAGGVHNNVEDPAEEIPPVKETPPPEDPNDKGPPEQAPATPEKIQVPANGVVVYKVVKGDTLWSISERAEVTVEKIKEWNSLTSDTINVGQILKIYGKNTEPKPPKAETPPTASPSDIVSNGNTNVKEIALTFDAGSDAAGIRILDVLQKYKIKATFFLTGKWVEKYPEFAKRIAADGHEIGNHSYSHPDAVKTTADGFADDIKKAENAIKNATGKSPRPYFRFPFGSYNNTSLKTVGENGYPYSIQWSLDTIDWQQPTVEVIISRIKTGASNGDIILAHIGGVNTPEAMDQVIPWLQAQGYKLVTLTELLK